MAADRAVLQTLVEEFVSGLVDSKAKEAAAAVKDGKFSALELVEALGETLTSAQPHTRARGVQLLSEVLHEAYSGLSLREVEVLITFYLNRLKDHYVVTPPVLQGLKALTQSSVLPPGSAVSMLRSLFQDVHVQSLMLAERACVYKLLLNLMQSREDELKSLGADFVFGFVQSMDGERDPRNLLLAFRIALNLLQRGYELGKFVEELFEVTSCYFPIDFSPPVNDPHGVTKEELVEALRAVLAATPQFAEFLLPLIIEKVDSDVQSAKLDSLQTLAACVSQYEHRDLAQFLDGLWTSIRREVFQTSSERVEASGLAALVSITSCVSRSVLDSESEDALHSFLKLVLKDCSHHLSEPDLKLVWPSAKLLQAACSASVRASHIITGAVLPELLQQFNSRTQCSQRRTLLEVIHKFVVSVKTSELSENETADDEFSLSAEEGALVKHRSPLCRVVFSALSESNDSLQVTACSVLTALAQHKGLLQEAEVEEAVDHLTRLLLTEENRSVCVAVVECSGALAALFPAQFVSRMIPRLKIEMFSVPPEEGSLEASKRPSHHALRQRCLSALAAVSTHSDVVPESTAVVLELLTVAHTGSVPSSVEDVVEACGSLQKMVEKVEDTEETGRCFHHHVIPRLLSLTLQAALQGEAPRDSPLGQERVLSALVPVLGASCSRLQPRLAEDTAAKVVSLFLNGDVSFLPGDGFPSNVRLLQGGCRQTQLLCLLMACVSSLPRSVAVAQQDELLQALLELSCSSDHSLTYTSAAKSLAALINKLPLGEALDVLIRQTETRLSSELDSQSSTRTQAFTLLLWVAKALLLRYHPLSSSLINKLFVLLDDADLGSLAADGFSLLMSDSCDALSRAQHADVRLMYRQRFFSENSNKLVQGFHAARERKPNYLKALSNIVNKLPKQVQVAELPALLTLLLEALCCPDVSVQTSTLSCLEPVLVEPSELLLQQLEALVSRLLRLTSSSSMNVRLGSLRCILALSHFPAHEILPFRGRVLRALARPLDDKKRVVRSEAVQARGEWFLLGSPGGR